MIYLNIDYDTKTVKLKIWDVLLPEDFEDYEQEELEQTTDVTNLFLFDDTISFDNFNNVFL